MLVFMLDLQQVMKFLSLHFQRNDLLLIEVGALLQKVYIDLENRKGGKGTQMLEFSDEYEVRGGLKGLN